MNLIQTMLDIPVMRTAYRAFHEVPEDMCVIYRAENIWHAKLTLQNILNARPQYAYRIGNLNYKGITSHTPQGRGGTEQCYSRWLHLQDVQRLGDPPFRV